jgi:predicted MFS family arabinose efflux permease
MAQMNRLLSRGFVALSLIQFLAFCNIAVFFPFYSYLGTLPIDPRWIGFLIGAYAFAAMVVRPFISPFLHPRNARSWMFFSSVGFIIALLAYSLAHGFWSMLVVRILHGAAHACLVSAMLALVVTFISKEKSGQAFGLLSVNTLLPYAVIPPIMGPLERIFGGFEHVLIVGALVMLLNFPLLFLVKETARDESEPSGSGERMSLRDIRDNLADSGILVLLIMTLLIYTGFTPVFFFIKSYGKSLGIGNPGLFFTIATLTMIGLRVFAGSLFDKWNKVQAMTAALIWLIGGYVWLAFITGPTSFYFSACCLGLGWGAGMPVLNALIFDCSRTRFRGLNINLSQEFLQAGFLLGPLIGGWVLSARDHRSLFLVCAILTVTTLALTPLIAMRKE